MLGETERVRFKSVSKASWRRLPRIALGVQFLAVLGGSRVETNLNAACAIMQ